MLKRVKTLLGLQSRYGDKPLKFHGSLSPKRDCSPEEGKNPQNRNRSPQADGVSSKQPFRVSDFTILV